MDKTFENSFGDKRIDNKASELLQKLIQGRSSSINFISENSSQRRSFYRLLQNDSLKESSLIRPITHDCLNICEGKNIVVINDTCEFNLTSHINRIKPNTGLGKTAKDDIFDSAN